MTTEADEGDAVEIQLQRVSAKLIDQLRISVPLFLHKRDPAVLDQARIRKVVKPNNTAKIERLINTFQEWPQLLDPALEHLIQPLVTAFVHYVQNHAHNYRQPSPAKLVDPLPRAICRLLYTFCKVRGPKVISRFFRNGPEILEPMLDAFELWNNPAEGANSSDPLIWEEKYVLLLWLSHLALTPFDLESISTPAVGTPAVSFTLTTFSPPPRLPDVVHRLLALALHYLSSVSKERDAAVSLLVRLSLRPDMQHLQLHHHLLQWVFSSLNNTVERGAHASLYFYTGILSYLAGFLRSGNSQTVVSFLAPVFKCIQAITLNRANATDDVFESAVARKLIIKIYRPLAVHQLSVIASSSLHRGMTSQIYDPDLLDSILDYLLSSLGDRDSTVRLTASKALSVITQKLDPDMSAQLVDDIIRRQQENSVYARSVKVGKDHDTSSMDLTAFRRGLTLADPLSWHGHVLTLSHLLYRRSAPSTFLSTIISLLIDALDFEHRSPMGTSLGGNVRDAACFGIWSIARKYSTAELLCIHTTDLQLRVYHRQLNSVIELLAAELVLIATMDPEGNIRRGASAALQELVGRHPDTVPSGIQLIQIVDYHAVGLRSRAMNIVSLQTVVLDKIYLNTIATGILSWRAISSPAAAVRRDAAGVLGHLVGKYGVRPSMLPLCRCSESVDAPRPFQRKREKSADEWHGIYLAHAAVIGEGCVEESLLVHRPDPLDEYLLLEEDSIFGLKDITDHGKAPGSELAIEALCTMIAAVSNQSGPGMTLNQLKYHMDILEACFRHCTGQDLNVVKTAAVSTFRLLEESEQLLLVGSWLNEIKEGRNGQLRSGRSNVALITVVGAVLQSLRMSRGAEDSVALQIEVLISQLNKESNESTKCAVLNHLFLPIFNRACSGYLHLKERLKRPLIDCLNDHTIDSRGDVGSDVRIAAINVLSKTAAPEQWDDAFYHEASGIVYGLAVEKLDKVRGYAWSCIREVRLPVEDVQRSASWSTDSGEYFTFIFDLAKRERSLTPMLKGFITTASVGTELLVRNSRIALLHCLDSCTVTETSLFHDTLVRIIQTEIPTGRLLRPAVEVLSFVLDNETAPPEPSSTSPYQALLQPLRTVHANTDLSTLQALVGVYAGFLNRSDVRMAALIQLHRLLLHRYPSIRLAAAGALAMVVDNEGLRRLDLRADKQVLRAGVERVLKESQRVLSVVE